MSIIDDTQAQLGQEIDDTLGALHAQLGKLRTGRANTAILDGIRVNYYGQPTPLNQCANLTVADARMLLVKAWDKSIISEIERAIMSSDIGIMPQNDGDLIRLPIPPLTEARRRDLVKQGKHRGEEAKIALRNHRRDANDMLRETEKSKEISQDELKRALDKVQETINRGTSKIDEILLQKEKEILEI